MQSLSRRRLLRLTGLGSLACLALPGRFSWATEPHIKASTNGVTDEEEIALGRKFADQVEQQMPIAHSAFVDRYLSGIVSKLAAQSQRPNLPYTVKLVNSTEVNAFSLAGGFLYLHRGLAELMTSEDELVAVLGHELGHVVGRHSLNEIVRNFAARRLLNAVLSNVFKNNGVVERIIAQFGGALTMITLLHFSREDEFEADLLGFYEMLRAGWDPHGMLKVFHLLESVEKRSGGANFPYLSTHPPTPMRSAAVERELNQVSLPRGLDTDSITFHGFKTILATLPPPPAPRRLTPAGDAR